MVEKFSLGDQIRETHKRYKNMDDFKSYINAMDQDYESEGAIFNGYIYEINTPQFNLVNRSQYGNGFDFNHEIFEHPGNNCFTPTKG